MIMPEPGTPTDWTEAYREVMETVWLATEPDDTADPTPAQTAQETTAQTALLTFAAEIRQGLAAGLLTAGPTVRLEHDHVAMPGARCVVCEEPDVAYDGIHPTGPPRHRILNGAPRVPGTIVEGPGIGIEGVVVDDGDVRLTANLPAAAAAALEASAARVGCSRTDALVLALVAYEMDTRTRYGTGPTVDPSSGRYGPQA